MKVLVDAHRGASRTHPENTLAAFRAALDAGADSVELDLHLSADGTPVVIHDETVDRTTDGRGEVSALTLAELRALDAGRWKGARFAGERIPTLGDALAALHGAEVVNLELKSVDPRLVDRVARVIAAHRPTGRVMVSSFHLPLLVAMKGLLPEVAIHLFLDRPLPDGFFAGVGRVVDSLGTHWELVDPDLVEEAARHGRAVWAWTVDDPVRAVHLARVGVTAITTNDPAAIRAALDRAGMR